VHKEDPLPDGLKHRATSAAKALVLGTLPGVESIAQQEYYANSRNAFWDIAERLLGVPRNQSYCIRIKQLCERGIALWDVLESAERKGSLDSKIVSGSEVPNDIVGFLKTHPGVKVIFLNGSTAGKLFRRYVKPSLKSSGIVVRFVEFPSTSPANTRYTLARKLGAWAPLADALRGT
jgi:double-stranded uracil-DNA glycosylase